MSKRCVLEAEKRYLARQLEKEFKAAEKARLQASLNFDAKPKRKPIQMRHTAESAASVERLLELASRVPVQVELRSPIQSSLAPERFL